VRNSENELYHLNDQRIEIGDKVESIEQFLHTSVDYMADFLENQIDFTQVRQNAMQKVYKEELLEKQRLEQPQQPKLPPIVSSSSNDPDAAKPIKSSLAAEKLIKTNSFKKTKTVEFVDAI
jgi:hypothetical protein